jgi:hypothetical protein
MEDDWPQFSGIGKFVKMCERYVRGTEMLPRVYVFQKHLSVISTIQDQHPGSNFEKVQRFLSRHPIVHMKKGESGEIKVKG